MYTWRVVVTWPEYQWASKLVTADTQGTAIEKVVRLYRRFYHRRVEVWDAYRTPESVKAEMQRIADAPQVPMTLSQAIEATLSGLHRLDSLADEYRQAMKKEAAHAR